jgi:hypothetical protein
MLLPSALVCGAALEVLGEEREHCGQKTRAGYLRQLPGEMKFRNAYLALSPAFIPLSRER